MRQRSLPRPLDTDHIAIVADPLSKGESDPADEEPPQSASASHPAQLAPKRMERAGSLRHKDASRQGHAIMILGLPLSPELAAIALGRSQILEALSDATASCPH